MGSTGDARLQLARTLLNNSAYTEAGELLHSLTAEQPDNDHAWFLLGACRHQSGQLAAALDAFNTTINITPQHIQARTARAQVLFEQGAWLDSLQHYEELTELDPSNPVHSLHCSIVLDALEQPQDALEYLDESLRINPEFRDALINKANLLSKQHKATQALKIYSQLLLATPSDATLLSNRADIHLSIGNLSHAKTDLESALRITPTLSNTRFNYCITLAAMGKIQQAQNLFAPLLKEDQAGALNSMHKLGMQPSESGQLIDFMHVYLWTAYKRQEVCNWTDRQRLADLYDSIADGTQQIDSYPVWMMFALLSLPVKDATRLVLAKKVAHTFQTSQNITTKQRNTQNNLTDTSKKVLNIAYIGGNFHLHPNFFITKGLYSAHNQSRVHVSIYALNKRIPKKNEDYLIHATDQFENVSALTDLEVAQKISDDEIDILIDLGTYNDSARPGILALRPAPIQISLLGSEISSGADFFDYRITDEFLVDDRRDLWSEKLLYLPGTC